MRILFAGDIVNRTEKEQIVNYELSTFIKQHSYAFCNLEGVVGKEINLQRTDKRGAFTINREDTTEKLVEAGFTGAILANNHIMDYGVEGLAVTLDSLEGKMEYLGAGFDAEGIYSYKVLEEDGIKVALFSVGENQFGACTEDNGCGYAWMGHPLFIKKIREARQLCNYVIVVCHCGAEELDVPLPEVVRLYHSFIDNGVDIVVGIHPHVIQGSENYSNGYIYYSLGNFLFEKTDNSVYNPYGLVLSITIEKDEVAVDPIETYFNGKQVSIVYSGLYEKMVNKLTGYGYMDEVTDYCINIFDKYMSYYLALSIGLDVMNDDKLTGFIRHRKEGHALRFDEMFILHNTMIETNRWIIERAVKSRNNMI